MDFGFTWRQTYATQTSTDRLYFSDFQTRYMKGTRQVLSRAANVSTTPCHLTNDEVIFHHLLLYSWSSIHSDNRIFRLYTLGVLFSISLVLHCRKATKNKENPVFRLIAWLALCTYFHIEYILFVVQCFTSYPNKAALKRPTGGKQVRWKIQNSPKINDHWDQFRYP